MSNHHFRGFAAAAPVHAAEAGLTKARPKRRRAPTAGACLVAQMPTEAPPMPPTPEPARGVRRGASRHLAATLRASLARGEITVLYQPVVSVADRQPVMVEALARWHLSSAILLPEQFIPQIERAGLARSLSMLVTRRVAAELAPLRPGLRLRVSINLPLGILLQPDLPRWLDRAIAACPLRAHDVSLELTETTAVTDRSGLDRALRRLRGAGFGVLLDDLGLDDPRLALLALPFAGCKLDRKLVEALPTSSRARGMVRSLLPQAAARGQVVIAEGVSDARLWSAVRGLGVPQAQGFGVGRPLPASGLAAWSRRWRAGYA